MATYFFGLNVGDREYPKTDGGTDGGIAQATTTGKDVEIVLNTTANVPSVEDLLMCIERLENLILRTGKAW